LRKLVHPPLDMAAELWLNSPPMDEETPAAQILEACSACGTLVDVTAEGPFSQIHCPSCGQSMRARKQFNNFTLQEMIGHGGMGEVFRALDTNLQRQVALKILRKEFSVDAEGRDKLAREAQLTASINHPHVVKVFSFGEARGQFYIAMELVEKGTLDDLMLLQRRVAEAQMLEVGIQIASGLQAGQEVGLIHRDLKPGNILFANAHTAKLVDFGLALVMDEVAAEKGEIWGTPYYIAPEKLDNQPEDFRSDIYSLGGTLFHAIAGRPPYEAETASMVALKQLKSQPVSLEAFAPDVSSETAYVINRMMAKNPDDRYQSYSELIEHLSYTHNKLVTKPVKVKRPKETLTVESDMQKRVVAATVITLLVVFLGLGYFLYAQRAQVAETLGLTRTTKVDKAGMERFEVAFSSARQQLIDGNYGAAASEFGRLASPDYGPENLRWMQANQGLALLLNGSLEPARALFQNVEKEGLYSTDPKLSGQANFFVELGRLMATKSAISPGTLRVYNKDNYEVMAFLLFGLKNWQLGDFSSANNIFQQFLVTDPRGEVSWIGEYKTVLSSFTIDYERYQPLAEEFAAADAGSAIDLIDRLNQAKEEVQTKGAMGKKLGEMAAELEKKFSAGS